MATLDALSGVRGGHPQRGRLGRIRLTQLGGVSQMRQVRHRLADLVHVKPGATAAAVMRMQKRPECQQHPKGVQQREPTAVEQGGRGHPFILGLFSCQS